MAEIAGGDDMTYPITSWRIRLGKQLDEWKDWPSEHGGAEITWDPQMAKAFYIGARKWGKSAQPLTKQPNRQTIY